MYHKNRTLKIYVLEGMIFFCLICLCLESKIGKIESVHQAGQDLKLGLSY